MQHIGKGSAAVAVACKSGHRAHRALAVAVNAATWHHQTKSVSLSPNPLPPGTTALPLTLWFCIHRHNFRTHNQLLLLLLNTNHLQTVHEICEQAHDNRNHIWPSRNSWTLACMRFWQFCKITLELHVHANSKWFSMTQSDVQKHEYSVQWTN